MITEQDVATFADISGDKNPVHLYENYAKQTRFGKRIAHGAFAFGIVSTRADKGIVTRITDCVNQASDKIAEGEAVVFHPDVKTMNH